MFHLHVHVGGPAGEVREFVKLGDGKLLELLVKWGPVILKLLGIELPFPLGDLLNQLRQPVPDEE